MGSCCGRQRVVKPKMVVGTRKFVLTRRDGTTATFGSRLEAEAERARSQGGGSIRPA